MKINASLILLMSLFIATNIAYAHNRVVVVPLAGEDIKPLKNIVTVAKENGDFDEPIAAMNSINDASVDNPYLMVIAPGIYQLSASLQMKNHVSIAGSGQGVTTLTGAFLQGSDLASAALLIAPDGADVSASIQDLSIDIISGFRASGIAFDGDSGHFLVSDVDIKVNSSAEVAGIWSDNPVDSSLLELVNVSIDVRRANNLAGIIASSASLNNVAIHAHDGNNIQTGIRMRPGAIRSSKNVRILVENGTGTQYGISAACFSSFAWLEYRDMIITVKDGKKDQYGLFSSRCRYLIRNLEINVTGGSKNQYGISVDSDDTRIQHTDIEVSGGASSTNYGVHNRSTSTSRASKISISNSNISVRGLTSGIGVMNVNEIDTAEIRQTFISATNHALQANIGFGGNESFVSHSILNGAVTGSPVCASAFESTGPALDASCQ